MKKVAVFTDLDGTFLDHHTYQYDGALPAVHWLKAKGVPLFSVSSKTLAEQLDLFEAEGVFDGYVAENGGVIHYKGQTQILGPSREQVEQTRLVMEKKLGIKLPGFEPENLSMVVEATGLSESQARLACERLCSNPLMCQVDDESIPELNQLAAEQGTILVHGGRFLTICGQVNKAQAMLKLAQLHVGDGGLPYLIALGDSANDLPMLHAADEGILMANPAGKGVSRQQSDGLQVLPSGGPAAWAEAVQRRVSAFIDSV